jgi:hypothetical protein
LSVELLFTHQFFLGMGALALAAVAVSWHLAALRRKELEALALSRGLSFSLNGPENWNLAGTGLELFTWGRNWGASSVLAAPGSGGKPSLSFFDYSYTTGSGRNRSVHVFTVALAEYGAARVPAFDLKPESFLHKIGELLGYRDIDIESAPRFSAAYRLTGPSEPEVRAFFGPGAVMCFESRPGWQAQGRGRYLALFKMGRVPAKHYGAFLDDARAMFSELAK